MAVRIQALAIQRAGEILHDIEAKQGARTDLGTGETRSRAADSAGLSERQRKTALRVANVPAEEFDRQVEPAWGSQRAEQIGRYPDLHPIEIARPGPTWRVDLRA